MKAIWKFPLESRMLQMPRGAQILTVQVQNEVTCVWAICDKEASQVTRRLVVVGTGWEIEPKGTYIGSFQLHGGVLVFHVFDEGEEG